ncbi:MAG: cytidylate kinase-like family protein [bacterium]
MRIACISRGSYSRGKEVAETLAKKLGCPCISREELVEAATKAGIRVGKLETAVLKPHIFTERLALEKEHFQAFSARYLLERVVKDGDIVYHGRAGHLLLAGISHVLRVRVVADMEYRISHVMRQMNLSYEKAKRYIEAVREDHARWVHMYYGVTWDEAQQYDLILNLSQMSVENAAAALLTVSQLPDFQVTPASRRAIDNVLLASRVRVALAEREDTSGGQYTVSASDGAVSVVYPLYQAHAAEEIRAVAGGIEGVRSVACTQAQTNLLWVQERFEPGSEAFREVVSLANKWGAAVELLRLDAAGENCEGGAQLVTYGAAGQPKDVKTENNGGIEEDTSEAGGAADDGGLRDTLAELARMGRSGGGRAVRAAPHAAAEFVKPGVGYTLAVVGEVFLDKGQAARTRMSRELASLLHERLRVPVVTVQELKQRYLFNPKSIINLLLLSAVAAAIYAAVFLNQEAVLDFLHGTGAGSRIPAAVCVFAGVPLIAYIYGTVARLVLKLLRIE